MMYSAFKRHEVHRYYIFLHTVSWSLSTHSSLSCTKMSVDIAIHIDTSFGRLALDITHKLYRYK